MVLATVSIFRWLVRYFYTIDHMIRASRIFGKPVLYLQTVDEMFVHILITLSGGPILGYDFPCFSCEFLELKGCD